MTVEMTLSSRRIKEASSKKGYKRSYVVFNEKNGGQLACCDLCGNVESSPVSIVDSAGQEFILKPSRKIMPSKWILTDQNSMPVYEVERASVVKLLNPIGRNLLTVHNLIDKKRYELNNLSKNKLDLMFGPSMLEWYLMEGNVALAGIERRKNGAGIESEKGFLSKLKCFLKPSNWILVTNSDSHLISAPAFIAMMMLFDVLTKSPE